MQESAIFKDEITKTLKSGAPVPVPGLFLEMVNCVLWRVGIQPNYLLSIVLASSWVVFSLPLRKCFHLSVTGRPVDGAVRKVLTDNVRESMKMAEGRPLQVLQVTTYTG